MENLKLGEIITTEQNRDAIHIAVVPVVAAQRLRPGERVWMDDGKAALGAINSIGVVDPFLPITTTVEPGQKFWLYLNPGSITSLRHEWTHPAFEAVAIVPKGMGSDERWLRDYADGLGLHYNRLMEGAEDWIRSKERGSWGEYLVDGGTLEGECTSPEFWERYERFKGLSLSDEVKENFFSCSC